MEPFALTCTTCKSRLKVRDPAVIGQIMACPKCGGMVLVKSPEPGAIPARGSSASGVVAKDTNDTKPDLSHPLPPAPVVNPAQYQIKPDAFDDVDELLGNVPARNMVPTPTVRHSPSATPGKHEHTPPPPPLGQTIVRPIDQRQSPDSQAKTISQNDLKVQEPAGKSAAHAAPARAVIAPQPAAAAAAVPLTAPVAAAAKAATPEQNVNQLPIEMVGPPTATLAGSPWQYWAMVSASALLGVVLAVGVVVITISWFSAPPAIVAQQPVPPPVVPGPQPEKPLNPAPPVVTPVAPPQPKTDVVATKGPSPSPEVSPPELKPEPAPMPPTPMPPVPAPLPERDPLGLTDPPPAVKPMRPSDDPLNKTIDRFLGGPDSPSPQDPVPAAPKPMLPPIEEDPGPPPSTNTLPKPAPRHVDVAARLADPLPGIEMNAVPLAEFLRMMQEMTTVPITLEPDGLAMVKLIPFSPETPITWKGAATTMGGAIQGALAPLGLEAKIEADQLVIDVASPQLTTTKLNVKDLTGSDDARAAELAAMLQAFIAPDSWGEEETQPTITATKDELIVRQHRQSLAQCVLLIEKLRVARGLKPASKFDPKLFELTTRSEQAQAALITPLTLNFSIPTPLSRVTERLGKAANVRILIDWQSLSTAGWNPDGEVTLTVEKKPLSVALNDLTSRMELAWRVVDAKTLQILAPQSLAERTELEFYPVSEVAPNEAAASALVAKIRTTLGGQTFRDAGGRGELRYDPASRCLIAFLSQPQQVQVASLLQK